MTNSYYLAHDVERRRSQLQAEAAGRPNRPPRRRIRHLVTSLTELRVRESSAVPAARYRQLLDLSQGPSHLSGHLLAGIDPE